MAVEWAEDGVRVNAVAPGTIYSPTAAQNYINTGIPDPFELAKPRIPSKRVGTTQEVILYKYLMTKYFLSHFLILL